MLYSSFSSGIPTSQWTIQGFDCVVFSIILYTLRGLPLVIAHMASAMQNQESAFWKDRFERTVRCSLPLGGAPYSRGDFIEQLRSTVSCKALEAIGPTARGNVWELTFSSRNEKTLFLDAGEFKIRDHPCTVSDLQKTRYKIRAHWLPYFLPTDILVASLVQHGCKVIAVYMDKTAVDELKHCSSNLRTIIVETDQPASIPHFVDWTYHGLSGRSMLTMTGRRPACLRCSFPGHVRKECNTPFCRRCKRFGHEMGECQGGSWAGAARPAQPTDGDLIDEDDDALFDAAVTPLNPSQPSPQPSVPSTAAEPSGSEVAPPPSSPPDAVDDVTPAVAPVSAPPQSSSPDAVADVTPASAPASVPSRVMVDAVQGGQKTVLLDGDFPPLPPPPSPSTPSALLTGSPSPSAPSRSSTPPPRSPSSSPPRKATLTPVKVKVTENEADKGPIVVTTLKKKGPKDSQAGGDMAGGESRRRRRGGGVGAAGGAPDDMDPSVRKSTNPVKPGHTKAGAAPSEK